MSICTNLVETYPRHAPTKFEVNLADVFGEEVKNLSMNIANPIDFAIIPIYLHCNQ